MPPRFTVFNESGRVVTTTGDGTSSNHGRLVQKASLYVDTVENMVFTFVPGETSLLRGGGRTENLYIQYDAGLSNEPVSELAKLLSYLEQDDSSSPSTVSSSFRHFDDAEAFEHSWNFQRTNSDSQEHRLLWQVAQAPGELPPVSELFQQVLTDLIADGSKLRLGMKDPAATAQAFKYFISSSRNITVAVPKQGGKFSEADIVLKPGASENYNPLDNATTKAIQEKWDQLLSSYTEEKLSELQNRIEKVARSASLVDVHYDLTQFRRYVDDEEQVEKRYRTAEAEKLHEFYVEIQAEGGIPSDFNQEIDSKLLEKLDSKLDELETEILSTDRAKLIELINNVDSTRFTEDYQKYAAFEELKDMVNKNKPTHSTNSQTNSYVDDFATRLEEVKSYHSGLNEVVDTIESELVETINTYISDLREKLIHRKSEDLKEILNRIQHQDSFAVEKEMEVLRVFEQALDGSVDIESIPDSLPNTVLPSGFDPQTNHSTTWGQSSSNVKELYSEVWEIANNPGLADDDAKEIFDRVHSEIKRRRERRQEERYNTLKKHLDNNIQNLQLSSVEISTALQELQVLAELCEFNTSRDGRSKNNRFQQVAEDIESVKNSGCLTRDQKTELLNSAKQSIESYRSRLLNDHCSDKKQQLLSPIEQLLHQHRVNWEYCRNELETMQTILDQRGFKKSLTDNNPNTQKFNKRVRELNRAEYLDDEDKTEIFNEAEQRIRKETTEIADSESTPESSETSLSITSLLPIFGNSSGGMKNMNRSRNPFYKLSGSAVPVVLTLLLVGAIIGGAVVITFGSSLPLISGTEDDSNNAPSATTLGSDGEISSTIITSPRPAETLASDTLVVEGTTQHSTVTVLAEHRATGMVYRDTVNSTDGKFEADLGALSAGEYRVSVTSNESSEPVDTQSVTFLANTQPSLNLGSARPNAPVNDSVVVSGLSTFDNVTIELYDANGTRVASEQVNTTEVRYDATIPVEGDNNYIVTVRPTGVQLSEYSRLSIVQVGG